jgi:hypothetical protein
MSTVHFSDLGDFQASYAAERWLCSRGFSVGSSQAGAPRAIWYGDCYISKWRGLTAADKRDMDARMDGDGRSGPVRITLLSTASDGARAAFALTDAQIAEQQVRANAVKAPLSSSDLTNIQY